MEWPVHSRCLGPVVPVPGARAAGQFGFLVWGRRVLSPAQISRQCRNRQAYVGIRQADMGQSNTPNSPALGKVFQGSLHVSLLPLTTAKAQGIPTALGTDLMPPLLRLKPYLFWRQLSLSLSSQKPPLTQFALTINLLYAVLALSLSRGHITGTA